MIAWSACSDISSVMWREIPNDKGRGPQVYLHSPRNPRRLTENSLQVLLKWQLGDPLWWKWLLMNTICLLRMYVFVPFLFYTACDSYWIRQTPLFVNSLHKKNIRFCFSLSFYSAPFWETLGRLRVWTLCREVYRISEWRDYSDID